MTERRTLRVGELLIEAAASGALVAIILWSGLGSALERRSVVAALAGSLFVGYGTSLLLLTCRSGASPLVVSALVITDPDKGEALTAAAAALMGQITGAAGGTLLARGLFGPLRRAPARGRM